MASGYCSSSSDTELVLDYSAEPYLFEPLKAQFENVDTDSSTSDSDTSIKTSEIEKDNW